MSKQSHSNPELDNVLGQETAKHTKTLWEYEGGYQIDGNDREDSSRDDMMDYRAYIHCEAPYKDNSPDPGDTSTQSVACAYGRTPEEVKANAARIVHCVNNFDALVEALKKLARLGNGNEYGNSDGNMIARAAIARATGEAAV